MSASLKALTTGESYRLGDFNLVGRSEEATIRLVDAGISRQHATIRREGAHYWLADLGSANGSYVNDISITTARVLKDGDRIQIGGALFLFDQTDSTHTPETTAGGMITQVLKRAPVNVRTQSATLLVGDLKGFTHLSSQLTAEQVADVLREWYSDCNAIMKRTGAMVDKFIGDCVFAYWPAVDLTTRGRAVEAARALREVDYTANSPMRKLLKEEKNIILDCRVGLHQGDVAIGAMGRGINTALGDAVNLTFRIEGLTRGLNEKVLSSSAFLQDWEEGQNLFAYRGAYEVKGHPLKVDIYALKD